MTLREHIATHASHRHFRGNAMWRLASLTMGRDMLKRGATYFGQPLTSPSDLVLRACWP